MTFYILLLTKQKILDLTCLSNFLCWLGYAISSLNSGGTWYTVTIIKIPKVFQLGDATQFLQCKSLCLLFVTGLQFNVEQKGFQK